MAFPFSHSSAARPKFGRSRETGPVFAVGRQAFVDDHGTREGVPLVDEKGTVALGTLGDGTEVEILAWIPRGSSTRYCVRSTKDCIVGWLGVSSLRSTRRSMPPGVVDATSAAPVSIPPQMPDVSHALPSSSRRQSPKPSASRASEPKRTSSKKRSG